PDDGQPEVEEYKDENGKLHKRVKKRSAIQGIGRGRGVVVSSDGLVRSVGRGSVSDQMRTALNGNPVKSGSSPGTRTYVGGGGKSSTLGGYIGGSGSATTFANYREGQQQSSTAQPVAQS